MNEPLAALVRRHDPDRFLTSLFAPAEKRDALLALYAFNHELARAREVVSEPPLALIRLHWWREVVEGTHKRHEVADPLSAALDAGVLDRSDLLAMLDAREIEAEPSIETLEAWRGYLFGSAGMLMVAAARLLGAPEPEVLLSAGAAYGAAGVLRSAALLARHSRCLLPADALARHRLSVEAFIGDPLSDAAQQAIADLAGEGRRLLPEQGRLGLPRQAVAAALPVVLARRDLRRIHCTPGERGLGDRLAVSLAGMTGRI